MIKCHARHLTVVGAVAEAVGAVAGVAEAVGAAALVVAGVAVTTEVGVSFVPFLHTVR